jgi:hypothetical protein
MLINYPTPPRPSAAMIVAAIALTIALSGSAIAATEVAKQAISKPVVTKIAKRQANAAIDQRAGSLNVNSAKTAGTAETAQNAVNAETAGSAKTADSAQSAVTAQTAEKATNADNAAAVGGITLAEINYSAADQSAPRTIFQGNGLTLTAACLASTEIAVTATTTKDNASIYASHTATDFDTDNTTTDDLESANFDLGDQFNVLTADAGLIDAGLTTFEYDAPDGTSITGMFSTDESTNNPAHCEAHGHLTIS